MRSRFSIGSVLHLPWIAPQSNTGAGAGGEQHAAGEVAMMTAEDVVKRIAAECAYVDARGGVGIRLKPAAAIVRAYGEQFRSARPAAPSRRRAPKASKLL
jgi:hypothetical protein